MFWCCCGGTCGQVCVTVTGNTGALIAGSPVEVYLAGVLVGSCTTNGSGVCCVPITTAGTYFITAGDPGGGTYNTVGASFALTCITNNVTISLAASANCRLLIGPNICANGILEAIPVTIVQNGVTMGVFNTSAVTGLVTFIARSGATITVSCPAPARAAAGTVSVTVTACAIGGTQSVTIPFAAASGYHCLTCGGPYSGQTRYPVADTLFSTDSVTGTTATLAYTSASLGYWTGTGTYSFAGCGSGCDPFNGFFDCNSASVTITNIFAKQTTPGFGSPYCRWEVFAGQDAVCNVQCPGNSAGSSLFLDGNAVSNPTWNVTSEWTPGGGVFSASMTASGAQMTGQTFFKDSSCVIPSTVTFTCTE